MAFPRCDICEKRSGYHSQDKERGRAAAKTGQRSHCEVCNGPCIAGGNKKDSDCDICKGPCVADRRKDIGVKKEEFKGLFSDPCSCGICRGVYNKDSSSSSCKVCAPHPCGIDKEKQKAEASCSH